MKSLLLAALLAQAAPLPADAPVADSTVTLTGDDAILSAKHQKRLEEKNLSLQASVDTAHVVILSVSTAAVVAIVAAAVGGYAIGRAHPTQ